MYVLSLLTAVLLNILVAANQDKSSNYGSETSKSYGLTSSVTKNNVASHHNITYIEKAENMLKTPNLQYYEERKKKKKAKKSPKRTIQKIIKKNNRSKLRKVYFRSVQTTAPPKIDYDKMYGQDEKLWREEQTTTHASQRRRHRKYSPKVAGYHMPFQKLTKKDKRYKRGGLSRELYILKDLDEIEFLSKEDGDDVVQAHVKNFW